MKKIIYILFLTLFIGNFSNLFTKNFDGLNSYVNYSAQFEHESSQEDLFFEIENEDEIDVFNSERLGNIISKEVLMLSELYIFHSPKLILKPPKF